MQIDPTQIMADQFVRLVVIYTLQYVVQAALFVVGALTVYAVINKLDR